MVHGLFGQTVTRTHHAIAVDAAGRPSVGPTHIVVVGDPSRVRQNISLTASAKAFASVGSRNSIAFAGRVVTRRDVFFGKTSSMGHDEAPDRRARSSSRRNTQVCHAVMTKSTVRALDRRRCGCSGTALLASAGGIRSAELVAAVAPRAEVDAAAVGDAT